jgi:hypothetical protein
MKEETTGCSGSSLVKYSRRRLTLLPQDQQLHSPSRSMRRQSWSVRSCLPSFDWLPSETAFAITNLATEVCDLGRSGRVGASRVRRFVTFRDSSSARSCINAKLFPDDSTLLSSFFIHHQHSAHFTCQPPLTTQTNSTTQVFSDFSNHINRNGTQGSSEDSHHWRQGPCRWQGSR